MMNIKEYIKRGLIFIFKGVPIKRTTVNIVTLCPNELLKNRTAFVTGGTSGIGYSIAEAFLNSGAYVIITGRDSQRLDDSCKKLRTNIANVDRVKGIVLDNTHVETFKSTIEKVIETIPTHKIDILVNNAGVLGGHIANATEDEYNKVLDTNLKGVFFLSQYFAHYMKENKIEGNILNIASSSSLRPAVSAYTLSKWGIRGLTLGLARSLAPYGITVNGIAPGQTATPMMLKDTSKGIANNSNLLGRYSMPEEIANMAVFLTSSMGRSILGDIVYMTGGSALLSYEDMNYNF